MANKIILKKSSVPSKIPLSSDLEYGELALNYADGKLYYKNTSNIVSALNEGGGSETVNTRLFVFQRGDVGPSDAVVIELFSSVLTIFGRSANVGVPV